MHRFWYMVLLFGLAACQPGKKETDVQQNPQPDKAAQLYQQGLDLDQEVDSLWEAGEDVLAEAPNEALISTFSQLVREDPNYARAAAPYLGEAYFRQKDYQKAVNWLSQATEAEPGNHQLFNLIAFSYLSLGQVDSAKNNLARSIGRRDTEANRQYIVDNLIRIGQTSFEYGVEYEDKGEFVTGKDYKNYGILVLRMAYDLHGSDERIARQIIAYAELVGDKALADRYREFLK